MATLEEIDFTMIKSFSSNLPILKNIKETLKIANHHCFTYQGQVFNLKMPKNGKIPSMKKM